MPENRINKYTCQTCHGEIITFDLDEGVTPFALACRATPGCGGVMHSSFYTCDQTLKPSYVWFRPRSLKGLDDGTREHVLKGGLVIGAMPINNQDIVDPELVNIIQYIEGVEKVSAVTLQRKFRLTYPAAARVIDDLVRRRYLDRQKDGKGAHLVINRKAKEPTVIKSFPMKDAFPTEVTDGQK